MHLPTKALAIAAAALVAVAGCDSGSTRTATPGHQEGPPLVGTEWRLTSFRFPGDDPIPVPATYGGTLRLDGRGHFSAKICNGMAGGATLDGARLTLTPGPHTLIGCRPLAVENQFDDTTRGTVHWAITSRTLTLTSRDGHQLTFRA